MGRVDERTGWRRDRVSLEVTVGYQDGTGRQETRGMDLWGVSTGFSGPPRVFHVDLPWYSGPVNPFDS